MRSRAYNPKIIIRVQGKGYASVPDQRLYKLNRDRRYGSLDDLVRSPVDWNLFREQWDQMVRVAVALKNRNAPEVVVQRLASAGSADRMAKALIAYGQVIKTIYILRTIQGEDLRRDVHRLAFGLEKAALLWY